METGAERSAFRRFIAGGIHRKKVQASEPQEFESSTLPRLQRVQAALDGRPHGKKKQMKWPSPQTTYAVGNANLPRRQIVCHGSTLASIQCRRVP